MFGSFGDCDGESVLDCLQAFAVDVVQKLITVFELGMNN